MAELVTQSTSSKVVDLFKGSTSPEVHLNSDGHVVIPPEFKVQIGSSAGVYSMLYDSKAFIALDNKFQGAILDVLYLILAPSLHNVLRFVCFDMAYLNIPMSEHANFSLVSALLKIFADMGHTKDGFIGRRLIRLIGIACVAGISESEMKFIIDEISKEDFLSLYWLHSFKLMFQNSYLSDATPWGPDQFFNFGGRDGGLFSVLRPFPFNKEYQIFAWFRLEGDTVDRRNNREENSVTISPAKTPTKSGYTPSIVKSTDSHAVVVERQSIFSMVSSESSVEICVENNLLVIHISDCRTTEVTSVILHNFPVPNCGLLSRTWYHVCIKHSKPTGLNFFGSDELTVMLNFKQVFQINVRFPNSTSNSLTELAVGRNFQGQIGAVTVCAEGLPSTIIEYMARNDISQTFQEDRRQSAGVSLSSSPMTFSSATAEVILDSRQLNRFPDLLPSIALPNDRKTYPISGKIISSYHPSRCAYGHALDLHGGRHARIAPYSFCSKICHPQPILDILGGMNVILPLFPNLLLEIDDDDDTESLSSSRSGLSSTPSKSSSIKTPIKHTGYGKDLAKLHSISHKTLLSDVQQVNIFSASTICLLENMLSNNGLLESSKSIGLLLGLLSVCVQSYRLFEVELSQIGAIEMVEYVLLQIPIEIFSQPDFSKACLLGIIQLRESCEPKSVLESQITTTLLCNFAIWAKASYDIQLKLMAVLLKDVELMGAEYYVSHVGVQSFLDFLTIYYLNNDKAGSKVKLYGKDSERTVSEQTSDFDDFPAPVSSHSLQSLDNSTPIDKASGGVASPDVEVKELAEAGNALNSISSPNSSSIARRRRSTFKDKLSFMRRKSKSAMAELMSIVDEAEDPNNLLEGPVQMTPQRGIMTSQTSFLLSNSSLDSSSDAYDVATTSESAAGIAVDLKAETAADGEGYGMSMSPDSLRLQDDADASIGGSADQKSESESRSKLSRMSISALSKSTNQTDHFQLTQAQKKVIRSFFRAIMHYMISSVAVEIKPVLMFIMFCRDSIVLEEITDMILTLLIDTNERVLIAITEAFGGVEEFASLVLQRLVSHKMEIIRCIGIRLLTHYYVRVDMLPPNIAAMTSKGVKGSILSRTIERLSSASGENSEMRRFQACGGLTVLVNYIIVYIQNCTDRTHSALVEMLMTKPGNHSQVKFERKNLLSALPDKTILFEYMSLRRKSTAVAAMGTISRDGLVDGKDAFFAENTAVLDKSAIFAGLGIRIDAIHDDECDVINAIILPTFFYMIPIFPSHFRDTIVRDLLGLLRSSIANQAAFCSVPQWHICMYSLVSQLIESERAILPRNAINKSNFLRFLFITATENISGWFGQDNQNQLSESSSVAEVLKSPLTNRHSDSSDSDMWFSLGMNVYAALLRHVLNEKDGWWEVMVTVSQAWTVDSIKKKYEQLLRPAVDCNSEPAERLNVGLYVSQAILSHLVSEMTFSMRKTYSNLKINIKSKNIKKSKQATAKLENILFVLTLAAEFGLGSNCVSVKNVPKLEIGRARADILSKLLEIKYQSSLPQQPAQPQAMSNPATQPRTQYHGSIDLDSLATAERTLISDLMGGSASGYDSLVDFAAAELFALPAGWNDPALDQFINKSTNEISINDELDFNQIRKKFVRTPTFCGDCLHPLERDFSSADGSLVLVLQVLRLFDSIFWPDDNADIRNGSLLKMKRFPSGMLAASTVKAETNPNFRGQTGMTLIGTIFRCSLFVLSTLSPINDLATLNALRLGYLLKATSNATDIPHQSTPVIDWMLASLVHVTTSLQRIISYLGPLFRAIGLGAPDLLVKTCGNYSAEEELRLMELQLQDSAYFATVQLEADENGNSLHKLNCLFDGTGGKNIFRFIKSCLNIFMFFIEETWVQEVLAKALDSRDFEHLSQFVDRIIRLCTPTAAGLSNSSSNKKASVRSDSATGPKQEDFASAAAEVASANATSSDAKAKEVGDAARKRADSSDSDNSNCSDGEVGNNNSTATPTAAKGDRGSVFALNNIAVLQLLRDPYLRVANLTRSLTVVRSLNALETIEKSSSALFFSDLETARQSMSSQSVNPTNSFVEESKALKSLATTALGVASVKERSRVVACRAREESRIKRAALSWIENLHSVDCYNEQTSHDPESMDTSLQCEISRLCDVRLNRMVSIYSADPKDHSDHSYFDVRQRENQLHLDSLKIMNGEQGNEEGDPTRLLSQLKPGSKMHSWLKDGHLANAKEDFWNAMDSDDTSSDAESDNSGSNEGGRERSESNMWNRGVEIMGMDMLLQSTLEVKRPLWSMQFAWAADEKVLFQAGGVIRIKLDFRVRGDLLCTNKYIYFHPRELVGGHGNKSEAEYLNERWPLDAVCEMFLRRYLQKLCAIEVFFVGLNEIFLAFASAKLVKKFWQTIRGQIISMPSPVAQFLSTTLVPFQVMYQSPWTDLWRRRLISNYEYLMRINIIAGRSFNDISQYPVFPWVIADYKSAELDLSNPASYRDLTKPMGALDQGRLNYYLERYKSFEADSPLGPAFMYGSHYSTEGYIIYYMIRQEPFTTLGVNLQEGKFDCPDRLFFSVQRAWEGCSCHSVSDVKELIPEFYTTPEIFLNTNNWPLGELQEGGVVGDVVLPPWANGSAFEFVRLNREALESEYVSEHLSDWIDLIFGYKQTGQAAIDANNVFHYLTYENALDIDSIEDEEQRRAVQAQVSHYGQTPSQVFKRPHVRRLSREECVVPLCDRASAESLQRLSVFTPKQQLTTQQSLTVFGAQSAQHSSNGQDLNSYPIVDVKCSQDRLVTCNSQCWVNVYKWNSLSESDGTPFQLRGLSDKQKSLPSYQFLISEETLQQLSFVPLIPSYLRKPSKSEGSNELVSFKKRSSQIYKAPSAKSVDSANSIESDVEKMTSDALSTASSSINSASTIDGIESSTSTANEDPSTSTASTSGSDSINTQSAAASNLTPTASRRPLSSLFGAIRKGINDLTEFSNATAVSSAPVRNASTGNSTAVSKAGEVPTRAGRSDSLGTFFGRTSSNSNQKTAVGTPNNSFELDEILFGESSTISRGMSGNVAVDRSVAKSLHPISGKQIAISLDKDGIGRVISCGYWDNAIKVHSLDTNKEIASINSNHFGAITCISIGHQNSHLLVTGSLDCSCQVWALEWNSLANACMADVNRLSQPTSSALLDGDSLVCLHMLRGHQSPISALSYCPELDLVLSADTAGILCLHTVRQGRFVRKLSHSSTDSRVKVDQAVCSVASYLVSYSKTDRLLNVFWVNGQRLASSLVDTDIIECMTVSSSGLTLVHGGRSGSVSFRSIWDLTVLRVIDVSAHGVISAIWFAEDNQYLLIGSQDGTFSVITDPNARWKASDISALLLKQQRYEPTA